MLFKLSNLNSNLALTLGYLNPALTQLGPEEKEENLCKLTLDVKSRSFEMYHMHVS